MIYVKFYTTLRIFLGITDLRIAEPVSNIRDLLRACEKHTPVPFIHKMLDAQDNIIPGVIILLNGKNILHLDGLETKPSEGDHIALFPPGGGG